MGDQPSEYELGAAAGELRQIVSEHSAHLTKINGSMDDIATTLHQIELALQRIVDDAIHRDATVITTAAAVEKVRVEDQRFAEKRWSPWAKAFAAVAALGVVIGIIVAIQALT